jgi:N-acetylmuramoyl-L-alanine amidase
MISPYLSFARSILIIFSFCSVSFIEADQLPQKMITAAPHYPSVKSLIPANNKNKLALLLSRPLIMIDPGHGGSDTGAQSLSKPRYLEKSLNLVTAKHLREYLIQLGYRVEMTRADDRFISLENRAKFANEKKPLLFVSIHYNSAPSLVAHGVEVYFPDKKFKKRAALSKKLAQVVLKQILEQTHAESRGIKQGNWHVIRETTMPAILVEGGFISNEQELRNLKDPIYLKKVAWGVAKGIDNYIRNEK